MQTLMVRIGAELSGLSKGLQDGESLMQGWGRRMSGLGVGLTAGLTAPILAIGGASIKSAMDAVESENLFKESFKGMSGDARAWSENLSSSLGLNSFELRKQSGMLFTMTSSMGLGKDAAFGLSTGLTKLAYDMASFYDLKPEEAFIKLRAGITGETEPLKQLGILVDENTVKHYAYKEGIAKTGATLTAQQKVLARYAAIMAQTSTAQDDLARTADSPSNKLRLMRERINETAIAFGMELMPVAQQVLGWLSGLVPKLQAGVQWFAQLSMPVKAAVVTLAALAAAFGPLLGFVGVMMMAISAAIPVLGAVAGAFGAVAAVVSPLGIALAALSAVVLSVPGAWDALKSAVSSTWGVLTSVWGWLKGAGTNLYNWLVPALQDVGKMFLDVAKVLGGPIIGLLGGAWDLFMSLGNAVAYVWEKFKQFVPGVQSAVNAVKGAVSGTWEWIKSLGVVDESQKQVIASTSQTASVVTAGSERAKELSGAYLKGGEMAAFLAQGVRDSAGDLNEQGKEAKKSAEAFKELVDNMRGAAAFKEAADITRALGQIGGVTKLTSDEAFKLSGTINDAIAKYNAMGQQAPPEVMKVAIALDEIVTKSRELINQLPIVGAEIDKAFDAEAPKLFSKSLSGIERMFEPLKKGVASALGKDGLFAGMGDLLKGQLGSVIQQAFQGGGDVGKSIGGLFGGKLGENIGKKLGDTIGGTLGSTLGSIFPGLGTAAGGLLGSFMGKGVGKAIGWFKGLFGGGDDKKNKEMAAAAAELQKQTQAMIESIKAQIATTREGLAGLIDDAAKLGYQFDASGQFVGVSFEKMREVAKGYGIDLASLGPAFQQAQLHASATQIINDFTLLTQGGADVGGVLLGMSGNISKLVQDSIKFGADIPENMRPWIEELIRAGLLTDANGAKIVDLTGIKFGEPVKTEFEKITDQMAVLIGKLDTLITRLADMSTAADAATRPRTIDIGWNVQEPPDMPSMGGFEWRGGPDLREMATGGVVFGPTPALVGEAGPEAVMPLDRLQAVIDFAANSGNEEVVNKLDDLQRTLDSLPFVMVKAQQSARLRS